MTPVFSHGSLRLYLLSLLDEAPRHGYELIQALTEQFARDADPGAGDLLLNGRRIIRHRNICGRRIKWVSACDH